MSNSKKTAVVIGILFQIAIAYQSGLPINSPELWQKAVQGFVMYIGLLAIVYEAEELIRRQMRKWRGQNSPNLR